MSTDVLTREALLAMSPLAVLGEGLRDATSPDPTGLKQSLKTTGALVLSEQLRAADVPIEALHLCIVAFDRGRDGNPTGELELPILEAIRSAVALQVAGFEGLARWMANLLIQVTTRAQLDAAIRFLEATDAIWRTNDVLRAQIAAARP